MLSAWKRGADQASRSPRAASITAIVVLGLAPLSVAALVDARKSPAASSSPPFRLSTTSGDSSTMHAIVVASASDCRSNLSIASAINRPTLKSRLGSVQLIVQGTAEDTVGLRSRTTGAISRGAIRLLTPEQRAYIHSLGHHATPIVLVFDGAGRLRLAGHAEAEPSARVALARAINHIVAVTPTH